MSAGIVRTYDPSRKIVSVAGVLIRGFIDGDGVTVAPESDQFEDAVGTDGEVTRVFLNDPRRTVTIRLMASSPSNDYLSQLANSDANQPGGAGVGVVSVRDGSGTTEIEGIGWIRRKPDVSYGREVGTREWVLRLVVRRDAIGGNPAVGA